MQPAYVRAPPGPRLKRVIESNEPMYTDLPSGLTALLIAPVSESCLAALQPSWPLLAMHPLYVSAPLDAKATAASVNRRVTPAMASQATRERILDGCGAPARSGRSSRLREIPLPSTATLPVGS